MITTARTSTSPTSSTMAASSFAPSPEDLVVSFPK